MCKLDFLTERYHSHLHSCFRNTPKDLNSSTILQFRAQPSESQEAWFRPYSSLQTQAFFFLSLNILGKQESHVWGTQDRSKHQKQAGNTAYKTFLAIFPNTLTGTKQERQTCFLCCVTHSSTTHTKDKLQFEQLQ